MAATAHTDVEQVNGRCDYTPEQVDTALLTLAANPNSDQASEILTAGGLPVPASTLRNWRTRDFPKRYQAICAQHAQLIERIAVTRTRELILAAQDAALDAIALEKHRINTGEIKDAAGSARNLATVVGIGVTKVLELEGRPTAVIEHRGDPLKQLTAKGYVNSTADEIPATEPNPESAQPPNGVRGTGRDANARTSDYLSRPQLDAPKAS